MQLQVKGKNMPVTDALFEHAERKLERLTRILPPWDEAPIVELELSIERKPQDRAPQTAEVTVRGEGHGPAGARERGGHVRRDRPRRAQAGAAGRPLPERRRRHRPAHEQAPEPVELVIPELQHEAEAEAPKLVKTKRHELKPMSAEDAALHMDMLHHDFYVFRDAETGDVNVVYRRGDGDFGLIVPEG